MTQVVFLIGEKASKSYSPAMYNAAFCELSIDMIYAPLDIKRDNHMLIRKLFELENVIGANVTMPHKINAFKMVESLTDRAKVCGAVNLIYYQDGILMGDNTDVISFEIALSKSNWNKNFDSAVIIGAGGVARAEAYALLKAGVKKLYIFNRTLCNAKGLAEDICSFKGDFGIAGNFQIEAYDLNGLGILEPEDIDAKALSRLSWCLEQSSVVVNTTSRGDWMIPEAVASEVFEKRKDLIICDLVYKPFNTKLLAQAQKHGLRKINGLELLLNQAVPAFEKWTGIKMGKEILLNSLANLSGIAPDEICKLEVGELEYE